MNRIKKFEAMDDMDPMMMGGEDTQSMSNEPKFTIKQLEGAFLSARLCLDPQGYRVPSNKVFGENEPTYSDFKQWYTSELSSQAGKGKEYQDIISRHKLRNQDTYPLG